MLPILALIGFFLGMSDPAWAAVAGPGQEYSIVYKLQAGPWGSASAAINSDGSATYRTDSAVYTGPAPQGLPEKLKRLILDDGFAAFRQPAFSRTDPELFSLTLVSGDYQRGQSGLLRTTKGEDGYAPWPSSLRQAVDEVQALCARLASSRPLLALELAVREVRATQDGWQVRIIAHNPGRTPLSLHVDGLTVSLQQSGMSTPCLPSARLGVLTLLPGESQPLTFHASAGETTRYDSVQAGYHGEVNAPLEKLNARFMIVTHHTPGSVGVSQ